MALKGYRAYRDIYYDNGMEISDILQREYSPDFHNRHTMQLWDTGGDRLININKWIGTTLEDRSLHEIYIVNNGNINVVISFSADYILEDEDTFNEANRSSITIGPNGTAFFYCTGILDNNNLFLKLRTGSQDDKKI